MLAIQGVATAKHLFPIDLRSYCKSECHQFNEKSDKKKNIRQSKKIRNSNDQSIANKNIRH